MSQTSEIEATPLRREKAMLMLTSGMGGTLALTPRKLTWKRSAWSWLLHGWLGDKGPKVLEVQLSDATFKVGGRCPPWRDIIVASILGVIVGGLLAVLVALLTGGLRKTIEVTTRTDMWNFSVKDVDSWLQDISRVRAGYR